jgi:uncharacterized protein involved in outer membrane biogenesis
VRTLKWIGLGLALFVALVFAGLALLLPRMVQSPASRARLEQAAREATGREFRYAGLDVGLLPPRVVLREASLAGAEPGAPAFVEARSVSLVLSLAPLLARAVVVDSLVIEGATLRLRRTASGFEWPRPPEKPREPRSERPPEAEPRPKPERADGGFQLAMRELVLHDVRLLVEDSAVQPAVTWDLSELDGRARAQAPTAPVTFELAGRLGSGGRLRGTGSAVLDGPMQLELVLESVAMAPLGAYVTDARDLSGDVSGTVRVQRGGDAPESLGADLVVEQGVVELEDVRVRGRIAADVDLSGHPLSGPFRLDATGAELATGGSFAFVKPPGTPATAEGRIVPGEEGGFDVDDVRIRLHNADVQGRVETQPRPRAELAAAPVELAGWEALLPGLGGRALGGRVELRDLALATRPLEVHGSVVLQRVRASAPRSPPLELSGALEGRGREIASEGLALVAAGQPIALSLLVSPLEADPRLRVRAGGKTLDGGALARAFAGSDAFEGPVTFDADVAAPLSGETGIADAAAGRVRVDVGRGRIRGVSLLRQSFDALGAAAEAALFVNRLRGSTKGERFQQDEFESLGATFAIGRGVARTDDLRLVYRDYTVNLRGSVGLADGRLDLTGDIVGEPELDAALAGEEAAPARRRPPLVIPLARVVGSVASPRVDLSPRAVASLSTRYGFARERSKLEEKIDEQLGAGAGRGVTDALEGLLGGGKRER